ncbi:MAG: hypothetical protein QM811_12150 [Pirellulales bacterium]
MNRSTAHTVEGVLVKTTDDWIVFGSFLSEGRAEEERFSLLEHCVQVVWNAMTPKKFGLHIEDDRPYRDEDFPGKPNIRKEYAWIPRRAIKSMERVEGDVMPIFEAFTGDSPSLQTANVVSVVGYDQDGNVKPLLFGDRVEIEADEISVVSEVPQPKIAVKDVCCVVQLVPFPSYWKCQAEIERKRMR